MRSTWPATSVTGAPREECRNATTASKCAESLHCSYPKGRFTGDVPPATTFRNSTKKNLSFLAAALLHLANIILCYLWGHPSILDTYHFPIVSTYFKVALQDRCQYDGMLTSYAQVSLTLLYIVVLVTL